MMNALTLTNYGASNFVYQQIEKPKITKPNHVLIKVSATACNPAEVILASGVVKLFMPLKFPAVLGLDYSGVIEEIGSGVNGLSVGQEVHGQYRSPRTPGTFAEYIVVEQGYDMIVPKPNEMSHEESAAFGTAGSTAYEGIVNQCKIKQGDGQRILIVGAAGGIGSYSVGISKALGAHVTGICSTGNIDVVKGLGADRVIDYKSDTFTNDLKSCGEFDCIMDTVGGDDYYFLLEPLLKRGGIYTSAVLGPVAHGFGDNFSLFQIVKAMIKSKWRNAVGSTYYKVISLLDEENTDKYRAIDEWIVSKKMKSPPLQCVPLADAAAAVLKMEQHKITGKLVFIP